jgi:transposase-like protein
VKAAEEAARVEAARRAEAAWRLRSGAAGRRRTGSARYGRPGTDAVYAQYGRVLDMISPKVRGRSRASRSRLHRVPAGLWRQNGSSKTQEWLNKEIRRRIDAVGIVANRAAIVRLAGRADRRTGRRAPTVAS